MFTYRVASYSARLRPCSPILSELVRVTWSCCAFRLKDRRVVEWKHAQRKNIARYHLDAASSGRLLVRYQLPGGFNGVHLLNCDRYLLSYVPPWLKSHPSMGIRVDHLLFTKIKFSKQRSGKYADILLQKSSASLEEIVDFMNGVKQRRICKTPCILRIPLQRETWLSTLMALRYFFLLG